MVPLSLCFGFNKYPGLCYPQCTVFETRWVTVKLSLLALNLHSSFITQFTRVPTHYKWMELKAVNGCSVLIAFPVVKRKCHWEDDMKLWIIMPVLCSFSEVISLRLEQIIGCPAGKRAPQSFWCLDWVESYYGFGMYAESHWYQEVKLIQKQIKVRLKKNSNLHLTSYVYPWLSG